MPSKNASIINNATKRYRENRQIKTISVTAPVKAKLDQLKDDTGAESYNEVIDSLICDIEQLKEDVDLLEDALKPYKLGLTNS